MPQDITQLLEEFDRKRCNIIVNIEKYSKVDEVNPFTLYAIELKKRYSTYYVFHRFEEFRFLHRKLMDVRMDPCSNSPTKIIEPYLPTLPLSSRIVGNHLADDRVKVRMKELIVYSQRLLRLLNKRLSDGSDTWFKLISEFFKVETHSRVEHLAAVRISKAFKTYKWNKVIRSWMKIGYSHLGFVQSIEYFPPSLVTNILSYLSLSELTRTLRVSKLWKECSSEPILWQSFPLMKVRAQIDNAKVTEICHKYSQIRSLDLRYCEFVTTDGIKEIAQQCNPLYLKKLQLDGCENITDTALRMLTSKFDDHLPVNRYFGKFDPRFNEALERVTKNFFQDVSVQSLKTRAALRRLRQLLDEEMSVLDFALAEHFKDNIMAVYRFKGGVRGLNELSLCECRNISDEGLRYLSRCKKLSKLNLMGCFNITDSGIHVILRKCRELENLNLGGTYITSPTVEHIRKYGKNLESVNVVGCKRLTSQDVRQLEAQCQKVYSGEDTFRFYLIPHKPSELAPITHSVLKSRSTLSMQRVYKYLLRKLNIDYNTMGMTPDSIAEILCMGVILPLEMSLQDVKARHWSDKPDDEYLRLTYRRKSENWDQYGKLSEKQARTMAPKPPIWTDKENTPNCMGCEMEFPLFTSKLNCRNCGRVFCSACSKVRCGIKKYSYLGAVRVCRSCDDDIYREAINLKLQNSAVDEQWCQFVEEYRRKESKPARLLCHKQPKQKGSENETDEIQ